MATLLTNSLSLSRSPSATSQRGALWWRSRSEQVSETSGVSSSSSQNIYIMSSQPASPAGSPRLRQLARGRSIRLSVENIGDSLLASTKSRDNDAGFPNTPPRSLKDDTWPPWSTVIKKPLDSPITEESTPRGSTLSASHIEGKSASIDALSPDAAPTCRNSLEQEMNVNGEDREVLSKALELLSLNPQPSRLGRVRRYLTTRTSTIKTLGLPESTKQALYALVTNAFAPYQLPAARQIQQFMRANPDTPLPPFLITKEIAEIYGEHGWCLIGQCGLERLGYKIVRLTSAGNITDEELERNQTKRTIEHLCGHIRDVHFEQMPFQCRLCPALYGTQSGLDRHWRTHPLGEFASPAHGDIFIGNVSLRQHWHFKNIKGIITAKFRRLLTRAVRLR